jgi:hypothetical protein
MRVKVKQKKIIDHNCLKIYTYNFQGSKHCFENMSHQTQKNPKIKAFTIHLSLMPWKQKIHKWWPLLVVNLEKPIFHKNLDVFFSRFPDTHAKNTLLVDDTPYKSMFNDLCNIYFCNCLRVHVAMEITCFPCLPLLGLPSLVHI